MCRRRLSLQWHGDVLRRSPAEPIGIEVLFGGEGLTVEPTSPAVIDARFVSRSVGSQPSDSLQTWEMDKNTLTQFRMQRSPIKIRVRSPASP